MTDTRGSTAERVTAARHGPGSVVGDRFLIEEIAGSGGMGTIFRAKDLQTEQTVALKILHVDDTALALERFAREAQVLAELHHPGIVAYIAHGVSGDAQPFIAMEWLAGEDLAERLAREPLGMAESFALLRRTADALAVAHRRSIVHRDIKPSNLYLRDRLIEGLTILDFGVARRIASERAMTRTGLVVGTPEYMAPEQVRGARDLLASADIFALGCVLFECLTGRSPFAADNVALALNKVMFEEPPPLRQLRPEAPEAVEALLTRMLAKSPERRVPDAIALLQAIDALIDLPDLSPPPPSRERGLHGQELSLLSVVVAQATTARVGEAETLKAGTGVSSETTLCGLLTQLGAQVQVLPDGTLVATVLQGRGSAGDQVALAARCALRSKERWPEATITIATGPGTLTDGMPAGSVLARALQLGQRRDPARPGAVVAIDEVTAGLLGSGFVTSPGADRSAQLHGEHLDADAERPLVGCPTPCVGREDELAQLEQLLRGCIGESTARGVWVLAPAGLGKSRLRREFLRCCAGASPLEVVSGRGEALSATTAYGVLGQLLRRLLGLRDDDALHERRAALMRGVGERVAADSMQRVSEFLGEVCGSPFPDTDSDMLRAARREPRMMRDQIRLAWLELLRGVCLAGPLLLVLEDLQACDGLTVRLIEASVSELRDLPFMALCIGRPEAAELFPLLRRSGFHLLPLGPLSPRACEQLARHVLGPQVEPRVVARIVQQSDGNALFLEELIRSAALGQGDERPLTVLALLQSRIAALPAGLRLLLRAASVFGASFQWRGLAALLGDEAEPEALPQHLRALVEAEFLARVDDEVHDFRHVLLREAAYGLLPEDDRRRGHRLAAVYLEQAGESDALVLAEHYRQGAALTEAVRWYTRASERAYANDEPDEALTLAERAIACGCTGGPTFGMLRAVQTVGHSLRFELPTARRLGDEAMGHLPAESEWWYRVAGFMIVIDSLVGDGDAASALAAELIGRAPASALAGVYAETLGRAAGITLTLGRRVLAEALMARLHRYASETTELDVGARASIALAELGHARTIAADPWRPLALAGAALAGFRQIGDRRNQLFALAFLGQAHHELGDGVGAEAASREAVALARKLGSAYDLAMASLHLASLLAARRPDSAADADEAATLAAEQAGDAGVTPGFRCWAHVLLAQLAGRRGEPARAEQEARRALELDRFSPQRGLLARGALVHALLAQGREVEASATAEDLLRAIDSLGGAGLAEIGLCLAVADARLAIRDHAGLRAALERARGRLDASAAHIVDPAWRRRFIEDIPEHRRLAELTARWLPS